MEVRTGRGGTRALYLALTKGVEVLSPWGGAAFLVDSLMEVPWPGRLPSWGGGLPARWLKPLPSAVSLDAWKMYRPQPHAVMSVQATPCGPSLHPSISSLLSLPSR